MAQRKYEDGIPVPRKGERCASTQTKIRVSSGTGTNLHHCKIQEAHTVAHRCICGLSWTKNVNKEQK